MAEHQGRPDQWPDVGILVTIRALLPNLAPVERRVAQIVLDDPAGVAWRSISELARSCGTSATSVVRFCRAVGLRGYPELRLALAGAVAHDDAAAVAAASSDIDPDDDAATITKKIAFADARAVTETASHLNIVTLTKVVDALAKASRIDIYGVGASGYVALDLQQKLQRIGRPAFAWPDPHMAITSASLREQGDVAIGLSHTGTTVDTIDALREARGHGAVTAAVTNFPWSQITEAAELRPAHRGPGDRLPVRRYDQPDRAADRGRLPVRNAGPAGSAPDPGGPGAHLRRRPGQARPPSSPPAVRRIASSILFFFYPNGPGCVLRQPPSRSAMMATP